MAKDARDRAHLLNEGTVTDGDIIVRRSLFEFANIHEAEADRLGKMR